MLQAMTAYCCQSLDLLDRIAEELTARGFVVLFIELNVVLACHARKDYL